MEKAGRRKFATTVGASVESGLDMLLTKEKRQARNSEPGSPLVREYEFGESTLQCNAFSTHGWVIENYGFGKTIKELSAYYRRIVSRRDVTIETIRKLREWLY